EAAALRAVRHAIPANTIAARATAANRRRFIVFPPLNWFEINPDSRKQTNLSDSDSTHSLRPSSRPGRIRRRGCIEHGVLGIDEKDPDQRAQEHHARTHQERRDPETTIEQTSIDDG